MNIEQLALEVAWLRDEDFESRSPEWSRQRIAMTADLLEAASKDAARYQHLKRIHAKAIRSAVVDGRDDIKGNTLDEVVDAAILDLKEHP